MNQGPDFARIMDPARREHFVYRAFDARGRLLYVGCSMYPEKRLQEHRYTSGREWWPLMTRVRLAGPYGYQTARRLEWEAIQTEDPVYNGQTPRNLNARREASKAFDRVFQAALDHGEPLGVAARQARIALDSEAAS